MGVVKVRSRLMEGEFVDVASTRLDRSLADTGASVQVVGDLEAMPVHRGRLRQMILQNDPNAVTLVDLNRWPRSASIKSPENQCFIRCNLLFHGFGNEVEDFYAVVQNERQVWNIWSLDRRVRSTEGAGEEIPARVICPRLATLSNQRRRTESG